MANSIEITGVKELLAKLDKMDRVVSKDINGTALFSAAGIIQKEIKIQAPEKSGKLANSTKRRRRKFSGVVAEVFVLVKGWQAHLIEFGVSPHINVPAGKSVKINGSTVKGPIRHPGFSANPFIRRSFDSKAKDAIDQYSKVISREIKKVIR